MFFKRVRVTKHYVKYWTQLAPICKSYVCWISYPSYMYLSNSHTSLKSNPLNFHYTNMSKYDNTIGSSCDNFLWIFMVVIMKPWIVMVFPSAPWKLICSRCHIFPFLFRLPLTWLFMSNTAGVYRKAKEAYPTGIPGPWSQFFNGIWVAH